MGLALDDVGKGGNERRRRTLDVDHVRLGEIDELGIGHAEFLR
jgi:hypothetical protein